jgi:hypothetical protein
LHRLLQNQRLTPSKHKLVRTGKEGRRDIRQNDTQLNSIQENGNQHSHYDNRPVNKARHSALTSVILIGILVNVVAPKEV